MPFFLIENFPFNVCRNLIYDQTQDQDVYEIQND